LLYKLPFYLNYVQRTLKDFILPAQTIRNDTCIIIHRADIALEIVLFLGYIYTTITVQDSWRLTDQRKAVFTKQHGGKYVHLILWKEKMAYFGGQGFIQLVEGNTGSSNSANHLNTWKKINFSLICASQPKINSLPPQEFGSPNVSSINPATFAIWLNKYWSKQTITAANDSVQTDIRMTSRHPPKVYVFCLLFHHYVNKHFKVVPRKGF